MSLTTYLGLKNALDEYTDRALGAQADICYSLARGKLYRGNRVEIGGAMVWRPEPLRVSAMLTINADLTFTNGVADLPSGALEAKRLLGLDFLPPDQFWRSQAIEEAGPAICWTKEGGKLYTAPVATTETLKVTYYAPFTAMSADTDADWVLTNAPQVWLHGCLAEAFEFEGNTTRAAVHAQLFAAAVQSLNDIDKRGDHSGATLVMRPTMGIA